MSKPDIPHLPALERVIGHTFKDPDLLTLALTHASHAGTSQGDGDNERLEFLGDRVLGLVIAKLLYQAFPLNAEGALARRYNALVRKETCADVARSIDLGAHLKLGRSERTSHGHHKVSVLGNACEALIGAIFLDGGFETAHAVVATLWGDRIEDKSADARDAKTALQEWAQAQGLPTPTYRQLKRHGPDHEPVFEMTAEIIGHPPATGNGSGKRAAEQSAARAFLLARGIWIAQDGE